MTPLQAIDGDQISTGTQRSLVPAESTNVTGNGHRPSEAHSRSAVADAVAQWAPGDSVHDLIRELREAAITAGVMKVAEQAEWVAARMPEQALRPVLAVTLRKDLTYRMGRERRDTRAVLTGIRPASSVHAPPLDRIGSAKWKHIHSDLALRVLSQIEVVEESRQKLFGDCTAAEVAAVAERRKKMALAHMQVGKSYQAVAAAMKEHEAKVVADLPEDVLLGCFR